jgi:pimeloyl-ACP methyl ester carboxylesterase
MPYTNNDGLRIHYTYEVTGSGEPLVLYHGLTGSGERWRDTGYVAGLADAYCLILIDARGHGESDKPHDQAAYGRQRQAGDVVAVLDDLDIDAVRFWGHSMGGDVALTLGRHHPERVSALVVTGYSPFAAAGDEAAEMTAWATDLKGGIAGFVTGYEQRHGTLPDDARARWLANDGEALAACVASMIAESNGSQVADLPAIETPVMLLVGTEEPFAEQAHVAAELLPRGAYVPLEGLDHVQSHTQRGQGMMWDPASFPSVGRACRLRRSSRACRRATLRHPGPRLDGPGVGRPLRRDANDAVADQRGVHRLPGRFGRYSARGARAIGECRCGAVADLLERDLAAPDAGVADSALSRHDLFLAGELRPGPDPGQWRRAELRDDVHVDVHLHQCLRIPALRVRRGHDRGDVCLDRARAAGPVHGGPALARGNVHAFPGVTALISDEALVRDVLGGQQGVF